MDTKDLRCFSCVYETKSINKAAKQLFITPQGLSKTIRKMEEELHIELFMRTKTGVLPTESAKVLYENTETLFQQFQCIRNKMEQLENHRSRLRIGCANGIFHVLPLQLILDFMKKHPEISVEWCEYSNAEVKEKLVTSELDFGFVVGKCKEPGFLQRKIVSREIKLLVYEGHPLYEKETVTLEMLRKERVLTMNEHFQMYHQFVHACQRLGFYPEIVAKTFEGGVLTKLCSQKIGVALIPDFLEEELRINNVRGIPFEETMTWDVYGIIVEENKEFETIQLSRQYLYTYLTKK